MTEATFVWSEHPEMTPLPRSYFIAYWTGMPAPLRPSAAEAAFVRLVRAGSLLQTRPPDLFS